MPKFGTGGNIRTTAGNSREMPKPYWGRGLTHGRPRQLAIVLFAGPQNAGDVACPIASQVLCLSGPQTATPVVRGEQESAVTRGRTGSMKCLYLEAGLCWVGHWAEVWPAEAAKFALRQQRNLRDRCEEAGPLWMAKSKGALAAP